MLQQGLICQNIRLRYGVNMQRNAGDYYTGICRLFLLVKIFIGIEKYKYLDVVNKLFYYISNV